VRSKQVAYVNITPSKRWRRYKFWLNIHLYLGLSVGLVFVLSGLTGSLLVFYVELDEILNPELTITAEQALQPQQNLETLYQSIKAHHPDRIGAWRLELPRHGQAMMMARFYKAQEKQHMHFVPLIAWVNPYSAEVVKTKFWGDFVMTWLYDLHFQLLLDKTGAIIMGIIGLLLLISLGIGLYLWWPKSGKFKTALTFKAKASSERFVYDLHKINGVYTLVIVLLLVLSGVILELPDYINPVIDKWSPLFKSPDIHSRYEEGKTRIPVDDIAKIAGKRYPEAKLRWLETPADANGSYYLRLYQLGEPSERFPKTLLWIDQYSGAILAERDPFTEKLGDTFLNWMHPLHSGEIAGLTGRIIVLISGLVPGVLYVTGFMRWQQKRKVKQMPKTVA
jgi:uncharacterized iron-regulated membrane protein